MKAINLLLIAIGIMVVSASIENRYSFEQYKTKFQKNYLSEQDHQYRHMIFEANIKKIHEINSNPKNTWKAGINHLTDRSPQELKALLGYNRNLSFFTHQSKKLNTPSMTSSKIYQLKSTEEPKELLLLLKIKRVVDHLGLSQLLQYSNHILLLK